MYIVHSTWYMLQVTGYRLQVTGYRLQVTGYRLQIMGYSFWVHMLYSLGFPNRSHVTSRIYDLDLNIGGYGIRCPYHRLRVTLATGQRLYVTEHRLKVTIDMLHNIYYIRFTHTRVQCMAYSWRTMYGVHTITHYIYIWYIMYWSNVVQCTYDTVHRTLYSVRRTPYTVYGVHCIVYGVQCHKYTVQHLTST